MKDAVTVTRVSQLHPKFIPDVTNFINEIEDTMYLKIRVVQGFRTFAEQDALYAQGRTKPGKIVTYSPAGASYHNWGIAVDFCPFTLDGFALDWHYDFSKIRPLAQKYGMTMGLDFPSPDSDHFENKYGYNWRDLLHKKAVGDFIPNTTWVRI